MNISGHQLQVVIANLIHFININSYEGYKIFTKLDSKIKIQKSLILSRLVLYSNGNGNKQKITPQGFMNPGLT